MAVTKAIAEATKEADIRIFFLIDKSGSMEGAIDKSKEALCKILQGFDPMKLHAACFDTMGTVLVPKSYSEAGIVHMLSSIKASGGTSHGSAVAAIKAKGIEIPDSADLIVFVVGDESGETGSQFAESFIRYGYKPSAFAHIVNVSGGYGRGSTVRDAAHALNSPYTEVNIDQFSDVYQIQRTLTAILSAAPLKTKESLVEKIMRTELLRKPY